METKKCSKCGIIKLYKDFHKNKNRKDKHDSSCRECRYKYNKINHNEQLIKSNLYNNLNRDKIREYNKNHYQNNKIRKIKYSINWKKLKYKTDNLYRLKEGIRSSINLCFRKYNNGNFIKSKKSEDILGCSIEEFKLYLESKFESWMNWGNKGNPKDGILEFNKTWDIDHITPISSILLEEDIYRLNHFTNLQPLCSKVNREIKRDKIDYEDIN